MTSQEGEKREERNSKKIGGWDELRSKKGEGKEET